MFESKTSWKFFISFRWTRWNTSCNTLYIFNLFPYNWFSIFELSLLNHPEIVSERCSGKMVFLELKTFTKFHLKLRSYLWQIPRKESMIKLRFIFLTCNFTKKANSFRWIFQVFCINFNNTFSRPALNGCFRRSETNKRTAVIVRITYFQFPNFLRCLRYLRKT